jgi:ribulose-5-phosphate 4-epimerase/fuculose-1-phosphate aldolase
MHKSPNDIASLRIELAAALRWSVRYDWHEAVANHFSVAVDEGGRRFLINPRQRHFSRVRASDLLLIDADDPATMQRRDAPDPTAWGLHGALHRLVPHARCALHLHPKYSTALACLADSRILPIDQNTVQFYNRIVIDEHYDGLAFEGEGERCAALFEDPAKKVMVMGNHGVLVIGETVGEAFDRLYYFERAAERMITAYMTGQPLRLMSHDLAEKTARQLENYPGQSVRHFTELKAILDREEPDYRD